MEIPTKLGNVVENQVSGDSRTGVSKIEMENKFQDGKSNAEKSIYTNFNMGVSEPVYNTKEQSINFLTNTNSEPCSSSHTTFRKNNFSKNTFFSKNKKHPLRRIGGSTDGVSKVEKLKKKKRLVKKL
ncbi:hypothetical protein WA026_011620 [Henosepilachna vigintioctopunctata]|uniref:Uncharacterized protein n=1 Tax=Henosepilachna vigintioctopunctata TaxID=420089 RepID=A0AAW1TL48_9CUCU